MSTVQSAFNELSPSARTVTVVRYPLHVVTAWLGNCQLVAAKHLQVTDEHFERASQKAAVSPRTETHHGCDGLRFAKTCGTMRDDAICTVAEAGIETSTDFAGNSTIGRQGDSQSDSLGGVSDPRLARLIGVWPALADGLKGEILRLAGMRSDDLDDVNNLAETDALDRFRNLDDDASLV